MTSRDVKLPITEDNMTKNRVPKFVNVYDDIHGPRFPSCFKLFIVPVSNKVKQVFEMWSLCIMLKYRIIISEAFLNVSVNYSNVLCVCVCIFQTC
jgi:hypothetical protein